LVVHGPSPGPVRALQAAGAQGATSPHEVAERREIVITMLPDSAAVREVGLGPDGVLPGARDGGLLIDMSTIHPTVSAEVEQAARGRGVDALDAPVSSGDVGAQKGTSIASAFSTCPRLARGRWIGSGT
jgi:2-hydroxy-3-oxopropionate reductase